MAAHKSPMEKSIRRMIRDGKTSKEIMEWTGVCSKTVAKYKKEVLGERPEYGEDNLSGELPARLQERLDGCGEQAETVHGETGIPDAKGGLR